MAQRKRAYFDNSNNNNSNNSNNNNSLEALWL